MSEMTETGYDVLRSAAGGRSGTRDAVEASGDDATTFLQGQLSQDVAALALGGSAWTFLLAPQGKIDAYLRVTRLDENRFILDVDAGWADAVIARLTRFRLRTRCDLTALSWASFSLRGPGVADLVFPEATVAASVEWAGVPGIDVLGPDLTWPADIPTVTADAFTALRIEAGEPMMGAEMDASTIPAATGLIDRSVSFTKGCYTGQELVARIDSRGGNVPQRLLGVVAPPSDRSETVLQPDDPIQAGPEPDAKNVGRITSVAFSPRLGSHVALAYVARSVDAGAEVTIKGRPHQLLDLPFPS